MRVPLVAALLLVPVAFAATDASAVQPYVIVVDGELATGLVAIPAASPRVLVVLCHGYGGSAGGWRATMESFAALGVASVAMDYRGERDAWKVTAGYQDTIAAALDVQARVPSIERTIVWGVSMGGEVSGLAVAHAPAGTFDYWMSSAGVQNLSLLHKRFYPLRPFIEAEAGGTPGEVPERYAALSPPEHADRIAAHGLARVFLDHARYDPIVEAKHSTEMMASLALSAQPVSRYLSPANAHASYGRSVVLDKADDPFDPLPHDWLAPVISGNITDGEFFPRASPPDPTVNGGALLRIPGGT